MPENPAAKPSVRKSPAVKTPSWFHRAIRAHVDRTSEPATEGPLGQYSLDELVLMLEALELCPPLDRQLAVAEGALLQQLAKTRRISRLLGSCEQARDNARRDVVKLRQRVQNFRNKAKALGAENARLRKEPSGARIGTVAPKPFEDAYLRAESERQGDEIVVLRTQLKELAFRHEQAKARCEDLQAELDVHNEALRQAAVPEVPSPEDAPTLQAGPEYPPITEIGEWACQFEGRLVLLPQAAKAAAAGRYQDATLSFRALEVLATSYRDMRIGLLARQAYNEQLQALRLEDSQTVTLQYANSREVLSHWFSYQGERVLMDRHLKRGGSVDERACFRAYFTWDEKRKLVVVGHLPSHLPSYVDV